MRTRESTSSTWLCSGGRRSSLFILFVCLVSPTTPRHAGRARSPNSPIIIRCTTFHTSWYVHTDSAHRLPLLPRPPARSHSTTAASAGLDDDDDDDFDEDSIPAFTHPQPSTTPTPLDKGKGRAQDTLLSSPAAAPNGTGTGTVSSSSSTPLAGNIGAPANGATPKADRRTVGGVHVETRSVTTCDIPLVAPVLLFANITLLTLFQIYRR